MHRHEKQGRSPREMRSVRFFFSPLDFVKRQISYRLIKYLKLHVSQFYFPFTSVHFLVIPVVTTLHMSMSGLLWKTCFIGYYVARCICKYEYIVHFPREVNISVCAIWPVIIILTTGVYIKGLLFRMVMTKAMMCRFTFGNDQRVLWGGKELRFPACKAL